MMSPSDEERIVAMVDSFTKTVARNFSRNLKRAKANAEKHYSDEPVDYLLETLWLFSHRLPLIFPPRATGGFAPLPSGCVLPTAPARCILPT